MKERSNKCSIRVSGIDVAWDAHRGTCTFEGMPVAMMWVDSTLAGMMAGVQAMVGTERFFLALQGEGRKSVEADWQVISAFPDFRDGFRAIANIAAVAGWGSWELHSFDPGRRECRFRVRDSWEGLCQKSLGVCWGSGMLAGKMAGYCSRLFGTSCWADQTGFIARGEPHDAFTVKPSRRSLEKEIENLLATDKATRADMAVALRKLEKEIAGRKRKEAQWRAACQQLTIAEEHLRGHYESLVRSERALKESEERYRELFMNAPVAIYEFDYATGRFIRINERVCIYTGYSREELMGMDPRELFTEESSRIFGERMRMLAEGREPPASWEYEIIKKDGGRLWGMFHSVFEMKERTPVRARVVVHDITERKQAQEALQENEARLRAVFDSVQDFIFIKDTERRYRHINQFFERQFGIAPSVFLGRTDGEIPIFENRDDTGSVIRDTDTRVLQGETAHYELTHLVLGTPVILDILKTPIRDGQGNVTGICGVSRDITERRKSEEQQRLLEERLRHADKLEAIGTLAGGIAHDFNNLLMAIQGQADLMLLNLDPSHPHYGRLKTIGEQVQGGTSLTRQLLGFAREGRYEVKPADINEIVKKTASLFGRTRKEITFRGKYGKNLWSVEAASDQLEQVFMNLCVNASQAMPGGGEIRLATENVFLADERAFPYAVKPGKYVKVTVSDSGTGMDEQTKARIFDPFFTTKSLGRGTGLGLAVVYGIVKGHGGVIQVESEPGRGTTFTIYIPASEKDTVKHKTETHKSTKVTETILLVDDEPTVAEVTRELLASLGYRVYAAGSGQEAIAVYTEKGEEIDLVILDMIMPGISGGQTFDRLREIDPGVRVLLSSGYSINGEAKTIIDRGCNGFLQKPYRIDMLSAKIREVLG